MAQPKAQVVHASEQCPPLTAWRPLAWHDPEKGRQVHGEYTLARPFGCSGKLEAGFWRITTDGNKSTSFAYSQPWGDETACVIDGTATLTVTSTGEKHYVGPGSIISSPKGLRIEWEIDAPYFKKFWCVWEGTAPEKGPAQTLQINHTADNPKDWEEYRWTEPKVGPLASGELYYVRSRGSTTSMVTGIWRTGKGFPGTRFDSDGGSKGPYTAVLGDETILVLEGRIDVTEVESGKHHSFRPGDIIGLTSGMEVIWHAHGPFCKKLFIITRDEPAN